MGASMLLTELGLRRVIRTSLLREAKFMDKLRKWNNYLTGLDDKQKINSINNMKKKSFLKAMRYMLDAVETGDAIGGQIVNSYFKGMGGKPFEAITLYMNGKEYSGTVIQPVIDTQTKQILGYVVKLDKSGIEQSSDSLVRTISVIKSNGTVGTRKDKIAKNEWLNSDYIQKNWNKRLWEKNPSGFDGWWSRYMKDIKSGKVAFVRAAGFFEKAAETVGQKEFEQAAGMAGEAILDTMLPAIGILADIGSIIAPPFAPALQAIGSATGIIDVTTKIMRKDWVATVFSIIGLIPAVGDILGNLGKVSMANRIGGPLGRQIANEIAELMGILMNNVGGEVLATFENVIKKAIDGKRVTYDDVYPNIMKAVQQINTYFVSWEWDSEKIKKDNARKLK
jgi:hypothetical protein